MKNLKTLTPKKLYQLTVTERIKGRAININKIYFGDKEWILKQFYECVDIYECTFEDQHFESFGGIKGILEDTISWTDYKLLTHSQYYNDKNIIESLIEKYDGEDGGREIVIFSQILEKGLETERFLVHHEDIVWSENKYFHEIVDDGDRGNISYSIAIEETTIEIEYNSFIEAFKERLKNYCYYIDNKEIADTLINDYLNNLAKNKEDVLNIIELSNCNDLTYENITENIIDKLVDEALEDLEEEEEDEQTNN